MTTTSIFDEVKTCGIKLFAVDGKLRIVAPRGTLTPELRNELTRHKTEIIEVLKTTIPAPDNDVIRVFKLEYLRLSNRISRVMDGELDRGYLDWTLTHAPELWRTMELSRAAWDTNERLESLKAGRIRWRDYRALMLAWAILHVKDIRLHREHLAELTTSSIEERAAIMEFDGGLTREEAECKAGFAHKNGSVTSGL